jgi:hypothetical protein
MTLSMQAFRNSSPLYTAVSTQTNGSLRKLMPQSPHRSHPNNNTPPLRFPEGLRPLGAASLVMVVAGLRGCVGLVRHKHIRSCSVQFGKVLALVQQGLTAKSVPCRERRANRRQACYIQVSHPAREISDMLLQAGGPHRSSGRKPVSTAKSCDVVNEGS